MAPGFFEIKSITVTENGPRGKRSNYTFDRDLSGEMTLKDLLDFTRASLIVLSDEVLKSEQAKGFDKNPIMVVDGKRGKGLEQVHPLGKVEFISRKNFGEILLDAYRGLLERSKVLTGLYKASHYVFKNGIQVAVDLPSLEAWVKTTPEFKEGDLIRIVNLQPYARRLELLGVTAGRSRRRLEDPGRRKGEKTGNLFQRPNGAYQLTSKSISSKYKNNVAIKFSFLPGSSMGLTASFKGSSKKTKRGGVRTYLYPSITFTVREKGIL